MITVRHPDILSDEDIAFAREAVTVFGESWKRPSDFLEEVVIVDVVQRNEPLSVVRELQADESSEVWIGTEDEYTERIKDRVSRAAAFEGMRGQWEDGRVEYGDLEPELIECQHCSGEGSVACPRCSTGEIACRMCGGSGHESCTCGGWGVPAGRRKCSTCSQTGSVDIDGAEKTCPDCTGKGHLLCRDCNGAGEFRCTRCNGSRVETCPACAGSLSVTCSDCNGEQIVAQGVIGVVEFNVLEATSSDATFDVPEVALERIGGSLSEAESTWVGPREADDEYIVARKEETRDVPVRKIEYEYNGHPWELFDIGGVPWANSYPKSRTRQVAPYAGMVAFVSLTAAGAYLFL